MSRFLRRPPAECPPPNGVPPAVAGAWASEYPALVEFLTLAVWDDGAPRAVGSITVFVDAGLWKLCLSDKDAARVAFVTGPFPEEVLRIAEAGLVASSLDWRAQRPSSGGKRRS